MRARSQISCLTSGWVVLTSTGPVSVQQVPGAPGCRDTRLALSAGRWAMADVWVMAVGRLTTGCRIRMSRPQNSSVLSRHTQFVDHRHAPRVAVARSRNTSRLHCILSGQPPTRPAVGRPPSVAGSRHACRRCSLTRGTHPRPNPVSQWPTRSHIRHYGRPSTHCAADGAVRASDCGTSRRVGGVVGTGNESRPQRVDGLPKDAREAAWQSWNPVGMRDESRLQRHP